VNKVNNLTLVKRLAKELRYRPLPELIGQSIVIRNADSIEEDLRRALAPLLSPEMIFEWPRRPHMDRTLAKYGVLDVTFRVPTMPPHTEDERGVHLLKKLGFLPDQSILEQLPLTFENDPTCLSELHDDMTPDQTFIRLWLEAQDPRPKPSLELPSDYLPRPFILRDACVSNAALVWFHKHFYL
jgi:hypothetical protein